MRYKITRCDKDTFKKVNVDKKYYFRGNVSSNNIQEVINNYVNELLQRGYSIEQIDNMEIKVFFT